MLNHSLWHNRKAPRTPRMRDGLLRLALVILASPLGPAFTGTAAAKGMPDGYTVEASINMKVRQTTVSVFENGRKKTERSTYDSGTKVRIFKLKGLLVVSFPDFQQGTVFTNDKARTKAAFKATSGKFTCKSLQHEGGGRSKSCARFTEFDNGFTLEMTDSGFVGFGMGKESYTYSFEVKDGDCLARLVGAKREWDGASGLLPVPGLKSQPVTETLTFNGSSCKLLKGRKSY